MKTEPIASEAGRILEECAGNLVRARMVAAFLLISFADNSWFEYYMKVKELLDTQEVGDA